jgi:hypothetical protein
VVSLDDGALVARDPGSGREMRIAVDGAKNLRIVAGDEDPLQGWVVQGKQLIEAPVLEFETRGARDVTMAVAWR